jgi:hypothetical protein
VVGQIAGRPVRSRAVVDLTTAPWVHDWRVLALAGGGVTAATLAITGSLLHASSFLGVGYYLVRFALLFAAISLIHWAGPHRTIGWGVATATAAYFLTDAVGNLHSSATAAVWLQFLSVIVFTGLLVIRGWPFAAVPRRLPIVPPTQRPLAYVTLAAAAALFFLFFVAVPFSPYRSGTIIDIVGALAALLAVILIAGLCCAVALAESLEKNQQIFVGAMILAYAGPELYFMLGSLLLGAQFTYLGDDAWDPGLSASGFVLIQAVVLVALVTTFLIMRRSERGTSGPVSHHH